MSNHRTFCIRQVKIVAQWCLRAVYNLVIFQILNVLSEHKLKGLFNHCLLIFPHHITNNGNLQKALIVNRVCTNFFNQTLLDVTSVSRALINASQICHFSFQTGLLLFLFFNFVSAVLTMMTCYKKFGMVKMRKSVSQSATLSIDRQKLFVWQPCNCLETKTNLFLQRGYKIPCHTLFGLWRAQKNSWKKRKDNG